MSERTILPDEGAEVTLLVEREGVPVTQRVRVGSVHPGSLLLQHADLMARFPSRALESATVLFERQGKLYLWPMRVEEILPTSCYLVADRPPQEGQRREFVRARVQVWLGLGRAGGALPPARLTALDISASGLSAIVPDQWTVGSTIAVTIAESPDQQPISAQAEVVRCTPAKLGNSLALTFRQLDSKGEESLARLVFRARELALVERLGRRKFV